MPNDQVYLDQDADLDARLRTRVQAIDELILGHGAETIERHRLPIRVRQRSSSRIVGIGIVAIALVVASWVALKPGVNGVAVKPGASAAVAATDTVGQEPVTSVLVPLGASGVSATTAQDEARSHVNADAVLVSSVAGLFSAVYTPLGSRPAPADVPPSSLVWVVTFTQSIVVCPPPYMVNGTVEQKPCSSHREATVSVVLDYASGAFIRSDGFAAAP